MESSAVTTQSVLRGCGTCSSAHESIVNSFKRQAASKGLGRWNYLRRCPTSSLPSPLLTLLTPSLLLHPPFHSLSFVSSNPQTAIQQRAIRVLKQKRLYESQLTQLQQQSYNMEQATMTTENLRNTMATVDAMQTANKEMRKTYGKIDIDKIDQVQDEMEDLIESANEIQESLGRSYGVPDEVDEADLMAELDAL